MLRLFLIVVSILFCFSAHSTCLAQQPVSNAESKDVSKCPDECQSGTLLCGETYYGKGNNEPTPSKSLPFYKKALECGYDEADLRVRMGIALWYLGRREEAFDNFRIAISMEKDNYQANTAYAQALLENKQYQEALDQFEIVKKLEPEAAAKGYFSYQLAQAYDALGIYNEAIREYKIYLQFEYGGTIILNKIKKRVKELEKLINAK